VCAAERQEVHAHLDQFAGRARRAVEAAEQLLPARLGGEVQAAAGAADAAAPLGDGLLHLVAVGAEVARERFEKRGAAGLVQRAVGIEHVAGEHRSGGSPRPDNSPSHSATTPLASIGAALAMRPPRRSRLRPRSEIDVSSREESLLIPDLDWP